MNTLLVALMLAAEIGSAGSPAGRADMLGAAFRYGAAALGNPARAPTAKELEEILLAAGFSRSGDNSYTYVAEDGSAFVVGQFGKALVKVTAEFRPSSSRAVASAVISVMAEKARSFEFNGPGEMEFTFGDPKGIEKDTGYSSTETVKLALPDGMWSGTKAVQVWYLPSLPRLEP